jgi:hypothetical protein
LSFSRGDKWRVGTDRRGALGAAGVRISSPRAAEA